MEREFNILNSLKNEKNLTQRDIARTTGMSLGNVNMLLRRLIKKGLLKMERVNPKTISYILTPKGLREKANATYNYITLSYQYIKKVNMDIENFIKLNLMGITCRIIIVGKHDEIYDILETKLKQHNLMFIKSENIEDLEVPIRDQENVNWIVIAWQQDAIESLEAKKIHFYNLLDSLES